MEGSYINPKELEILPVRLVQAELHKGLTQNAGADGGHPVLEAAEATTKYPMKNRKFAKDAIAILNRSASLFMLYIASIAQEQARSKKRETIYEKDVIEALKLGLFWEIEREMSEEMQQIYKDMASKNAALNLREPASADADELDYDSTEEGDNDDIDVDEAEDEEHMTMQEEGTEDNEDDNGNENIVEDHVELSNRSDNHAQNHSQDIGDSCDTEMNTQAVESYTDVEVENVTLHDTGMDMEYP